MKPALLLASLLLAAALAGCAGNGSDAHVSTPATSTTTTTTPVAGTPDEEDFESVAVGALPEGWTVGAGEWSVEDNASAPEGSKVLVSAPTELGETWILDTAAGNWSDVDASVMFNVLGGEKGQAGGIVFRYEDEKNYYVVRYNHNELSWNLFRTIDGDRQKFPGTDAGAEQFHGALHQWTELRLEAVGDHITVLSGGVKVIEYTEEDARAPQSGLVGLWTRYDSHTQFDSFSVAAN